MNPADKALPLLIGVVTTVMSWWSNEITAPIFGVPASTVCAGAMGALVALAYDNNTKNRPNGKRYAQAAAAAVAGATLSGIIPARWSWTWAATLQGALAILFTAILYFLIPPALELVPDVRDAARRFIQTSRLTDWLPFLKRRPAPEIPAPPPKDETS
ncbi:hypothetical protein [Pseudoxanthomonas sp. USHLN014]|uniref:hypothetical protein n=1 Tax=Pseudoxanthomonas sp. USHLN014 TaxID=3081297 RepID=UPI00301E260A